MKILLLLLLLSAAPVQAAEMPRDDDGIMMIIARMMHCNDLASKSNLSLSEHQKIDAELAKYQCATVSCDLMKIVDKYFPSQRESSEVKTQMAQLGVCR